jgi:hypothetical protein
MPRLPTGSGQNDRGTKHAFDAGKMGSRDDGKITPNRKGLLMAKTNAELIDDIRRAAREIRDVEHEMPIVGSLALWQIQELESYSNALHIFCKLLRQRLEAQQQTTEGE